MGQITGPLLSTVVIFTFDFRSRSSTTPRTPLCVFLGLFLCAEPLRNRLCAIDARELNAIISHPFIVSRYLGRKHSYITRDTTIRLIPCRWPQGLRLS